MVSLAIIYVFVWHGCGTSISVIDRTLFFQDPASFQHRMGGPRDSVGERSGKWGREVKLAIANTKTGSWDAGRSCSESEELWHSGAEHKGGTGHMVLEKGKLG